MLGGRVNVLNFMNHIKILDPVLLCCWLPGILDFAVLSYSFCSDLKVFCLSLVERFIHNLDITI